MDTEQSLIRVQTLGHSVTYVLGIDITGDAAANFDVVLMSATNLTANIRDNGFESIPQPILTWESSMVRNMPGEFYLTTEQILGTLGSFITVVDASHPILAGLQLFNNALNYALGAILVVGDFNGNGVLDSADIDDLTTQSAGGTNPAGEFNSSDLVLVLASGT